MRSLRPRKEPSREPAHAGTDLRWPASRTVSHKCLLFIATQSVVFCHSSPNRLRQQVGQEGALFQLWISARVWYPLGDRQTFLEN